MRTQNYATLVALLLMSCTLGLFAPNLSAQTCDAPFVFEARTANGFKTLLYEEHGGWSGTRNWGGSVSENFSGEVVWGYDAVGNDSLTCDTITRNYTGKIVMVRRGVCNFVPKCRRAALAGAIAVIVVNNATGDDLFTIDGFGTSTDPLAGAVTVPCIFLSRTSANPIIEQLRMGQRVDGQFKLRQLYNGIVTLQYQTPVNELDTLDALSVTFHNRSDVPVKNVVVKADVISPTGKVGTVEVPLAEVQPGIDTFVVFPSTYMPPKEKGVFRVVFSNSAFTEKQDSFTRRFISTASTYGTDNTRIISAAQSLSEANFNTLGNRVIRFGTLAVTGDHPEKATQISFIVGNAARVIVPNNPAANTIEVALFDGDADDNRELDIRYGAGVNFDNLQMVANGFYILKGTETATEFLNAQLEDLDGNKNVALKPNHYYIAVVGYDGKMNAAATPKPLDYMPGFAIGNDLDVDYYSFPGSTFLLLDRMYASFTDIYLLARLQTESTMVSAPEIPRLAEHKLAISPNPADKTIQLNLKLDKPNGFVNVLLFDAMGYPVRNEVLRNYTGGVLQFDAQELPSGLYIVSVRTEEGAISKKISVCH